jgi:polysaccharide export outer membrane protein
MSAKPYTAFRFVTLFLISVSISACAMPGMNKPSVASAEGVGLPNVELIDLDTRTAVQRLSQIADAEADAAITDEDADVTPAQSESQSPPNEYRVGPHDVLDIVIWGRPELNNPGGMTQTVESRGRKVRADGSIFFPFVGVVQVEDHTVEEIREKLTNGLNKYIKNPQVDVRVSIHKARKYYVTGEVNVPGIQYVESQPKTILDAISEAGGMTENADLSTVIVTRDGEENEIDLTSVYERGDVKENIWVKTGDTIHVPDNTYKRVFVMGEVEKQTAVPMHKGRLTLAEALAAGEGVNFQYANVKGIYVLRQRADEEVPVTMVYRLNAKSASSLLVADMFQLEPRDVVFVSTLGLTRWNRVITQILPTVQTIFQTDTVIKRR